jgi:hypothetical protein
LLDLPPKLIVRNPAALADLLVGFLENEARTVDRELLGLGLYRVRTVRRCI